MSFSRKPVGGKPKSFLHLHIRRHPFLFFGLPFVVSIVGISFLLRTMTRTRYEYAQTKIQTVSKEEQLHLDKARRKINLREEYFRLMAKDDEGWENKRISRLPGQAEWGELPPTKREPDPPPRLV